MPPERPHPADERLSNPEETCIFRVYGRVSVCLTDLDELRYGGNWNTFTMWWVHTYPWWKASGELMARVRAILRRHAPWPQAPLHIAALTLETHAWPAGLAE